MTVNRWNQAHESMISNNIKLGPGLVVGKIIAISVADGYAYYNIEKVGKKTVTFVWNDDSYLNPDKYHDLILGGGASISIARAQTLIQMQDSTDRLFAKN